MFKPSDDPNIEADLDEKYPNTEDKPHKSTIRLFLLPGLPGASLLNKTDYDTRTRLLLGPWLLLGMRLLLVLRNLYYFKTCERLLV